MNKKEVVYKILEKNNIKYEAINHKAVYTIDEMIDLNLPHENQIAKNLFLRDDKKRNYYLLSIREEKKVNLKALRTVLNCRPLSFASENDLENILGLSRGAVTPFGLFNDTEHKVKVFIDRDFEKESIGVHPNENTTTVWLKTEDLISCLKGYGVEIEYLDIP